MSATGQSSVPNTTIGTEVDLPIVRQRRDRSRIAGQTRPSHFRSDVEGLRAVAVGLVLLYHAGIPFIPGGFVGVDVFFVISGFLITGQLLSELQNAGTISLTRFYARRAKRLLPAAGVVLVATAMMALFFIPQTRWREIGGDIVASAIYIVNWRFADRSVDYLAEDASPSPVQHFWSLAVEEQFYLVWPLLMLAALLVARVMKRKTLPILWIAVGAVVIPSFVWSLIETAYSPARAFFETTTRMWELGIGAAVALAARVWPGLRKSWAVCVGWLGMSAVAASGVLFSSDIQWPGYSAALPVLGAAAVIVAGFSAGKAGPVSILGSRPFCWVGRLSYSLYLWHWPLLVSATAYLGGLSLWGALVVVGVSVLLAWLTLHLIENPLRYSSLVSRSSQLALSMGANFSLIGVTAGLSLLLVVANSSTEAASFAPTAARGATVLGDEPRNDPAGAPVDVVEWMTPRPSQAAADIPRPHADGCQQTFEKSEVIVCEYGDRDGEVAVAVVGDSKINQWTPALEILAEQNGWRLTTYLKSSCSFALVAIEYDGKPYEACRSWTRAVLDRLKSDPPDYVLTSQGQSMGRDEKGQLTREAMVGGLRALWSELTASGSKVIVIADNPHPDFNVYECVEKNPKQLSRCTFSRDRYATSAAPVQHEAVTGQHGVAIVDLFDAICPTDRCAPVIGNVLIYRQGSHITATYIYTLTPRLARALTSVGLPAVYRGGP